MENKTPRILTRSRCDKAKCPRPRRDRRRSSNVVVVATRIGDGVLTRLAKLQQGTNLLSLPQEIHLVILSHLSSRDLHTMTQVSVYFEELAPMLWKDYEVLGNKINTERVIRDLKRMPFLKKICINSRTDCDEILRQISLSNKNLEQLSIINCTGSTSGLQLRAGYLTRIVKRCRRLHTFQMQGSRTRGLKLFRMMAEAGPRLRSLLATTTRTQFQAFAQHARHVAEKDREQLYALPHDRLASMQYRATTEPNGQPDRIVVTYQDSTLGLISLELEPANEADSSFTDSASATK